MTETVLPQIPMFQSAVSPDAADAVKEVLASGMLGEGPKVEAFTARLQDYLDNNRVVCLNSCTSALIMALKLYGIRSGKKVLSSPFTMVATNCAIAATGADIEWFDPSTENFSIDHDEYKEVVARLSKVDAVILTLVGGVPPHYYLLEQLRRECHRQHIPLILDAAHGLTTSSEKGHISEYADMTCLSFQSIKHLNTVDGGALVINKDLPRSLYDRAKKLKWFGMSREVPEGMTRLQHQMTADVPEPGNKWHMNDVCATIGLANWDLAFQNVEKSTDNALFYNREFSRCPELHGTSVKLISLLDPPRCSWWVYGLLVERRDELIEHLAKDNIVSTPMWRRNDFYSGFKQSKVPMLNMDEISKKVIFIPNGFWVTAADRQRIVDSIKTFYKAGK